MLILLYSQVGYYLVDTIYQYYHKEEMKEWLAHQLPDSALESISLVDHTTAIQWETEGREFTLNGEWYDVVRTKTAGNNTILLCIKDRKEEAIWQQMNNATANGHQQDNKDGKQSIFKLAFGDAILTDRLLNVPFNKTEWNTPLRSVSLPLTVISILIPPPKA